MSEALRYEVRISISRDELQGLMFVADSFDMHMREGLGTGDADSDRQARAAARWICRINKHARPKATVGRNAAVRK